VKKLTEDPTIERIRALMARTGWTALATARYLGVPHNTLGSWITGKRRPSRAVKRLLDVLGIVEALSPSVHEALMKDVV